VYYVTRTLTIPAGSRLVGEAWSVILGGGSFFSSQANPQVMVRAGTPASSGTLEITDLIFSTRGPAPGAIVMEWNVHGGEQGAAGMWDSHIRLGGATGTNLNGADCVAGTFNQACWAAFLGIHLTPLSSVYLEGTWVRRRPRQSDV
jgi:glucan 1,3-beta-glucosidase